MRRKREAILLPLKKLTLTTALLALLACTASAATLPTINCAKDKANVRCSIKDGNVGKIGSGLPFNLGGYVTIGSGFVDDKTNTLYVPVEFGGQQDNQGLIFAVDLKTGNRQVVSGYDGEEMRGKGQEFVNDRGTKATAYDLGNVLAVRAGPTAGTLLALVDKGLQSRTEILNVDIRTGDRRLVWASKGFDDAAREGPTSIRTIEKDRVNPDLACRTQGEGRLGLKPSSTFESDGKFVYLFMNNNPAGTGSGLVKIPVAGGKCEWVSQYFPDGTNVTGSGPTINTLNPFVFGSALQGGEWLGVTGPNPSGNVLFGIKLSDGTRRTISALSRTNPARRKGEGDSELSYSRRFAITKDGLALTMGREPNDNYFEPILVKPDGSRVELEAKSGSLKDSLRDSYANVIAAVPATHQFLVSWRGGIHVFDADTGASYLLSQ